MYEKNIIEKLSSLFIFTFVFSFFNDNYMVEHFGDNSLKLLFVLFFLFYGLAIIRNLRSMTLFQDRVFFLYAVSLTIVFLLESILDMTDYLFQHTMTVISLFVIVIYFSRYPLQKLLYFIWLSVMLSIVMSFFNAPLSEWTFRTTGGTGDPNEFAAQVLVLLFISIYLFNINKSKIFLLMSILFVIYGIFIAGSKTSFVILMVIGMLAAFKYLFLDVKKLINYKFLIVSIILLVSASQIEFTEMQAVKNIEGRTESSGTFDTRVSSWTAGYYMTLAHPLLGVGLGDYTKYTQQYATEYVPASAIAPHNIYIKVAGESGIIVLLIFLFFLIILFVQNFKVVLRSNIFWIYISFLSLLLMGLTLGITYDKYFLLFIAIMLNVNYLIKKKGEVNENITHNT